MIRKESFQPAEEGWPRLLLVAVAILLPACSESLESHPPLFPVKGKVNRDGKPMPGGTIIFEYAGDGPDAPKGVAGGPFRATAKNHDGAFNLNGYAGAAGMPAGSYKVGVLATQGRSESHLFSKEIVLPQKRKSAIPADRYADPKTSGLQATVKEQDNDLPPIELK